MNIIDVVRTAISQYPQIDTIIHVDYNDEIPGSFGLYPTGDTLIRRDILGNQVRKHTFVFYAVYQSVNDYDRLVNSGTLLELQMFLENYANEQEITLSVNNVEKHGTLKRLSCSNGMLIAIPDNNMNSGVRYQLQITAEYELESEE